MAIEITIPRLGWSMDEGTFGRWLKQDGEQVEEGDALFELEGDKAVQTVESFDAGVLRIIPKGPSPGDTVRVGDRLAYLCRNGEASPFEPSPNDAAATTTVAIAPSSLLEVTTPEPAPPESIPVTEMPNGAGRRMSLIGVGDPPRVSPRAARAAATFGVNLAEVNASSASGRIRERDVMAVVDRQKVAALTASPGVNAPTSAGTSITSIRQTIATRMLAAAQQTAAVTLTASADASSLVLLRRESKAKSSKNIPAPSFTDMFVKLSAVALARHPDVVQQWTEQGLVTPASLDIAVAVDTPQGLLTPVLRDVAALPLNVVSQSLTDLITRARMCRLAPEETRGGVFTVTNLGGYRVEAFTPLLNMPQTAILGVGRIAPQPMAVEGRVEVCDRVTLSLTFDHRVVDGATAAALLTTLCELVENPPGSLLG
jgi:pyruvate dehydrogenase E2 component (dihydrolipoamide acetyltransferase)